jgi:hypothetical protein
MDLREVGWEGIDWIDLGQDKDRWWAVVNAVMNLRIKCGRFIKWLRMCQLPTKGSTLWS